MTRPKTPDAVSRDRSKTPPRAEIRAVRGTPTLVLEGKPVLPLLADIAESTSASQITMLITADVALFRLTGSDLSWTAPGKSDFDGLDARIKNLLAVAPEGRFLLEVIVEAPEWWRRDNQEERLAWCLPSTAEKTGASPPVSFASEKWQKEACEALRRLARHIAIADWGPRCIGLQLSAGAEGEWRLPEPERLPDIGPCMTEQFRAFALDKYRRNAGLLRKAWFDARADFNSITCPNAKERQQSTYGIFRSPTRSRRLLDYYECLHSVTNTAALHFCSVLKRESGGLLVGLAYGRQAGLSGLAEDGHAYPEPVLDSPDVDFLIYSAPDSGGVSEDLTGSLNLRGKMLFQAVTELQPDPPQMAPLPDHSTPNTAPQVAVIVDPTAALYTAPSVDLHQSLVTAQLRELAKIGEPFALYLLSDLFHPKFPDHTVTFFLNTFYLSEAERRRVDARIKRKGQTGVWFWSPGVLAEEGITAEYGEKLCGQKLRLEPGSQSLRARLVETSDLLTSGFGVGMAFGRTEPAAPTVTIADRASTRLGSNTANKTVFAVQRYKEWTSIVYGTTPVPSNLLRKILAAQKQPK